MKLKSLDELFRCFSFVTPDYQRGYAWGIAQVNDFWNDIGRIGMANPQHFTGTLILEVAQTKSMHAVATVVDGQQRLTTAVLLAAAVSESLHLRGLTEEAASFRGTFLGSKDAPAFRYGPGHDTWPFLALQLFQDASIVARAGQFRSAYTRNLECALDLLRGRVKVLSGAELTELVVKFRSKLVFNVVEVDPAQFNIHVAFESINHRGKQLTRLELLKNRLIYIATVMSMPEGETVASWESCKKSLREAVNKTWGDIYSWLGREGAEALDDEEFLRTHSIIYFEGDTGERDWLETLLFNTKFSAESAINGSLEMGEISCYLNSLSLSALLWSHQRRPRGMPATQILWLNRINHVRRQMFEPLILAAYIRLIGDEYALATDLTKTAGVDDALIQLLKEIERFIVLVFMVTGRRSHTGRKEFAVLAHALHERSGHYAGDATESFQYLTRYIRSCTNNINPDDQDNYTDEEFDRNGWLDLSAFKNTITKALRHDTGYYGQDLTRLVLFEYEEHLRARDRGAEKVTWDRVSADTIEHVYPQDDTHWRELTLMLGGGKRKARVNSYRHSLGNLVLLNGRKNSELQNKPYTGKITDHPKRPRFEQGSYSETNLAATHRSWTPQAIERRGKVLLQFAEQRWGFSFLQAGISYKSLLVID